MDSVQVLVWFLLLAHAGRDEVEAAPNTRYRRESKSQNENFARSFPQQNQQLRVQTTQQFQQDQVPPFQPTPTQNSAAFPDVFNAQPSQFQQGQIPLQQQQQQQQNFQTQFAQQPQPVQQPQSFPTVPQQNQFRGAPQQQNPGLSLTAGPGSGRSLFDQIVNRINSGHREKARRKQGASQSQPKPSNPFSDPTIAQSQGRIAQNPNFPRVNPTVPEPPVQVVRQNPTPVRQNPTPVRQNPTPVRQNPTPVRQANQQSSQNLGLALFGRGNQNRFAPTSTQTPNQPFFPTEAVPNKDLAEVQREKQLEEQRRKAFEEQRLRILEQQRIKALEE